MTERVKAGGYENRQCLSHNQRLAKAVGLLRCRGARAAEARLADPVSSSEARRTFAANLRRLFLARDWSPYAVYQRGRKIGLPWSSQSAALRVPPLSQPLMSCIQKPTTALMRRGSTAKPPSPDSPPRSLAKTSGPWRKLAEMNGSRFDRFNERVWPHQDAEGDLHDRTSSFVGLNAPGPRGSWTEGTPHFHSACYEGALSGIRGAGGQTLAHKQRLAPVGRSQVPPARSKGPRGACV
jgi:hypothetical protein